MYEEYRNHPVTILDNVSTTGSTTDPKCWENPLMIDEGMFRKEEEKK